jgi:autotransporter-associated beta strand protein
LFSSNPASSVTQTINFGMNWNNSETLDTPANGNLALNGNINSTVDTSLVKLDTGTLSLGGSDSIQSWELNGGTTILTGNVTINGAGSSRVYLGDGDSLANCSGTLIIQPSATLTMSGNFGDAFVIGRDGGSGLVIQNGGTFNYTGNQGYMFVGATSDTNTSATYDMYGGLLNMGGNTLGVGLGDNSVVYTATLNQTNGAINNLFKLDLGAVRAFGKGVYNLSGGSITIDIGGITSDDASYAINLGGGTVAASSSWASSLAMTLTGLNGPVTFNTSGNTITLSGPLSGPGGLMVSGGGILELSGANSYLGDTLVSSGFLQLDTTGSSSGAFRIVDGGLFNLNFSGNYLVAKLYTNGVPVGLGTYNSANLGNFITGGGNLQVVGSVSTGHWTGLGVNNNWSTAGNWDGNAVPAFPIALTFGGNNNLNNNNDLTGITIAGLTFSNTAGAFTIGGNAVTMNGNIGFIGNPSSSTTQAVNLNMTFSGPETIDAPANAVVSLGGNLTSSSDTSLIKLDAGGLVLGGTDSLQSWDLDSGATTVTGTVNINGAGGSRIYVGDGDTVPVCNGSLVIQPGAMLSVVGNYADAMVIGRDGGSGTVVQNGGTFSFNPANQTYLFIGASGNTATRSEYDMNGGVLDMNGKTLGIALGVNILITGVVNQVSGVITNVGNLWLDSAFSTGYSIYNLTGGSLYIGAGGITTSGSGYQLNLGGGTIGAEASWSSSQNMNLTGINGAVTFNLAGNAITLSGVLSGTGGLMAAGGGTLELSGANIYTGNTVVNGTTLKLDSTSNHSGAFQLSNGATLNLNYSGTLSVASASTNGVALAVGTYNSSNLPAFITGTGSLQVVGSLPTTPTNIGASVSGGKINITWPANYQGWILQQQTNSVRVGLSTNWVDVSGSANVTSTNFPVNAAPVSFYRLRYPSP